MYVEVYGAATDAVWNEHNSTKCYTQDVLSKQNKKSVTEKKFYRKEVSHCDSRVNDETQRKRKLCTEVSFPAEDRQTAAREMTKRLWEAGSWLSFCVACMTARPNWITFSGWHCWAYSHCQVWCHTIHWFNRNPAWPRMGEAVPSWLSAAVCPAIHHVGQYTQN